MSIAPLRSCAAIHCAEICTAVHVIILHILPANVNVPAVHFLMLQHLAMQRKLQKSAKGDKFTDFTKMRAGAVPCFCAFRVP